MIENRFLFNGRGAHQTTYGLRGALNITILNIYVTTANANAACTIEMLSDWNIFDLHYDLQLKCKSRRNLLSHIQCRGSSAFLPIKWMENRVRVGSRFHHWDLKRIVIMYVHCSTVHSPVPPYVCKLGINTLYFLVILSFFSFINDQNPTDDPS